METPSIVAIVLLLVLTGMLIGTGVLTLDKFGRATRTPTTVVSTGLNLSAGSSQDFSETYCTDIVSVANSTTSFDLSLYNVSFSDADGCVVKYSPISACRDVFCNITYKYGADSTAATTTNSVTSAITPIASTWLPLVVTVVVLSIILTLVITSFIATRK